MRSTQRKKAPSEPSVPAARSEFWDLRLYVAGQTPNCLIAFKNLQELCRTHLDGRFRIEVIDLLEHPHLAKADEILAIPTLVRRLPPPLRKIVGDLSNVDRVLVGLDIVNLAEGSR